MKILCTIFLVAGTLSALAQSETYSLMRENFRGEENVVALGASGFLAKTALWISGEHEFRNAIEDVKNIRLIVVPLQAFKNEGVSVKGLKKLLATDRFEEVARVRERGDDISIFLQSRPGRKDNRYFILIEEKHEVVAIELTGYINPDDLSDLSKTEYSK